MVKEGDNGGLCLADQPMPIAPHTIVYRNPDGSVFVTYTCQPYGDWRDSDPMYVHPEYGE
jgi:hypothetical protein